MPLVAFAVAAYVCGALAAYAGHGLAVLVGSIAALGAAVVRRDVRLAGLAITAAAGALIAAGAARREARCLAAAPASGRWRATLLDAASPGAFVPAVLHHGACGVRASIAVERGAAPAGADVAVRGTAVRARRRLTIQHARIAAAVPGDRLVAWRAALGDRIDATFGRDAPLVRALVIADTRSLDPTVRDRFAAAGIVHMLSISGLHVGLIAAAVQLLFVVLRLPRPATHVATLVVAAVYVAVIGAPRPALRAVVMLGVASVSRLAQRPTSPWASLALGAAVPLADPRAALDLGWQLSVAGMASLIASGALARRWITPRWDGWRARLAHLALASVVASLVTAPLVAWTFGRVSVIAPLANIAATPIIAVLQPALFLATITSGFPPVARFVADAAHPLLAALDGVARGAASVPFAALSVAPSLTGAVLAGVASIALVAACISHSPARPVCAAITALAAAMWLPLVPVGTGGLEVHVIDVGQGDAIALHTPRGRWVVVDAGRVWRGGDAGRATVVPYLRRRGGPLALFVLTHPHADHAGGAATLVRALQPAQYWDGAFAGTSDSYRASLVAARAARVRWHRVHPGEDLDVDGVSLRVLAPDSAWMASLADPNEASVVLLVRFGAVRVLLMGDAERGEEQWLLAHLGDSLHADVLKVGHHGSATSSTAPFLDAVAPRLAIVSVGAGNGYGHPSPAVMRDLARRRALVLRTDRSGSVVVRTDGRTIEVDEEDDRWLLTGVP